ncbi:prepilin-type N-terminal cleavage/methylation domain-containing protein [Nitriliruptoraceae bacterium ZYF776]|nr:prepilin-type N-terminal cleavage/methylation domain-containing protein [Profundirhabdus halotolerans]
MGVGPAVVHRDPGHRRHPGGTRQRVVRGPPGPEPRDRGPLPGLAPDGGGRTHPLEPVRHPHLRGPDERDTDPADGRTVHQHLPTGWTFHPAGLLPGQRERRVGARVRPARPFGVRRGHRRGRARTRSPQPASHPRPPGRDRTHRPSRQPRCRVSRPGRPVRDHPRRADPDGARQLRDQRRRAARPHPAPRRRRQPDLGGALAPRGRPGTRRHRGTPAAVVLGPGGPAGGGVRGRHHRAAHRPPASDADRWGHRAARQHHDPDGATDDLAAGDPRPARAADRLRGGGRARGGGRLPPVLGVGLRARVRDHGLPGHAADHLPVSVCRRRRDETGFTLVELLVVMVLAAIIGTAVVTSIVTVTRVERTASEVQDDLGTARIAVDRLRRELRGAVNVTADSGPRQLQFRVVDPATGQRELVTWSLVDDGEGGALLRRREGPPTAPTRTIAGNLLLADVFTYDRSPPATGAVDVALQVASSPDRTFLADASVRLRNVRN